MNPLCIDKINSAAPYIVSINNIRRGYYDFETDCHVKYSVGFDDDDLITSDESYQLVIINVNHRASPRDVKVKDTIMAIVDEFFNENNVSLLYICETSDSKQKMRSRLFEYWFSTYKYKSQYVLLSSSVKDAEGVDNYATIIIRKDNPHLKEVGDEFMYTISVLNQKPTE